ncbi:MAG: tetratricopeptide repeat protein, partial [Rhodanobacter sp.]
AARKANAAGVQVSVLGVGTTQGGRVPLDDGVFLHDAQDHMTLARRDDASLARLAAAGGGVYVAMTADHADVDALHARLRTGTASAVSGQHGDEWQDQGPWLLLPLLLIAALAFRRGWLLMLPLVVLPMLPGTASAASWNDLWQRPDQQAAQALRAGQSKQAQQLARDPAWRGAAAYRAGDFAAAAQSLQQAPGGDAAYNLGNALARQGQYPQAISAYDKALKLDPANADAKANRQAVEDWLRQRQQKKNQPQNQPRHEGGKGGKNQSSADGKGSGNPSDAQQKPDDPSAQPSKPSDKPGQSSQSSQGPHDAQQSRDAKNQPGDQPKADTPQQQAEQQARSEQAQQALKKQMDMALAGQKNKQQDAPPTHQLGITAQDDPRSKLPADLQHALQRVPDDPGALLRRKFQLEYLQRHGGAPEEDAQP